ncbi:hypothetical protein [Gelidibacter maritimus]|uniref:Uncharacterized protein n=1 Tax=Gelidibacter maritimus TaxID=2761487 RepID=A0A7W2M5P6_9FLAO|nr:hypothetical protein [Gelidibacter maritimus]MBA6153174.1 hypothetical protein [Gelidibacter maritimus]
MKTKYVWILLTIAALITIYGVLSGKFFFLFLMLPFGFGLFRRNDKDEDK